MLMQLTWTKNCPQDTIFSSTLEMSPIKLRTLGWVLLGLGLCALNSCCLAMGLQQYQSAFCSNYPSKHSICYKVRWTKHDVSFSISFISHHFLYRILDSKKINRFQFSVPGLQEIHFKFNAPVQKYHFGNFSFFPKWHFWTGAWNLKFFFDQNNSFEALWICH